MEEDDLGVHLYSVQHEMDGVQFPFMARGRGERAGLTREAVLDAGLAVLEREGAAALSMRRVATELGVAPNALYSHIADKDALVDGVFDRVLGTIEIPQRGAWRARIERIMEASLELLLAHPDLIPHAVSRQAVGPNALRLSEAVLEQLARGGITGERAVRALQVLLVHMTGSAAFTAPRRAEPEPAARARRARAAAEALDPGDYPHTTAGSDAIATHPGDEVFRLGLRWILDGLSAS
jgi:TetR/AcrR family transcriptional regulator, tetracycline repressor protein